MGMWQRVVDFYKETRLLQVKWYLYWYRWFLKALVNSFRQRMGDKASKLATSTSIHVHPPTQECGSPVILGKRICTNVTRTRLVKIIFCIVVLFTVYHIMGYLLDSAGFRSLGRVDPKAVRGYTYCPVNETRLKSFAHQYTCDFKPMPNRQKDVIIFTFVNSAWITMARNWICSAEKVGIKDHLFLIALEPNVCSHFQDIPCYEHPHANIPGGVFGDAEYQKLVVERTRVVLKLLSCKKRLLLADADIVFLKNPLDYLKEVTTNKDIVFQADSSGISLIDTFLPYFFRYICGGFIYMKPINATKLLWLSVLHYQESFKWNDQAGLNICIRHHTHSCTWDTLNSDYFPNGKQFFDYEKRSDNNMIVHANHLTDKMKISRMMASEVWCDRDVAVTMCEDRDLYKEQCDPSDPTNTDWCSSFREVCHKEYKVKLHHVL